MSRPRAAAVLAVAIAACGSPSAEPAAMPEVAEPATTDVPVPAASTGRDRVTWLAPPPLERPATAPLSVFARVIGGYELEPSPEVQVWIEPDGRVVKVTDRTVYAGVDDFTTLRLNETGLARVAEMIESSGVLEFRMNGHAQVGPHLTYAEIRVGGVSLGMMDDFGRQQTADKAVPGRTIWVDVIAKLSDLTWVGDDGVAEPLRPWVPDSLYMLAQPGPPREPSAPSGLPERFEWPFADSISVMSHGTTTNAYDEVVQEVCLYGDDVAPVWAWLTGINNAWIPVADADGPWTLTLDIVGPGEPTIRGPGCRSSTTRSSG